MCAKAIEGIVYQDFVESKAILKGHFILSSGLHSDTYLQCARVLMDAKRASRLCCELAQKIRSEIRSPIDMVVSPAMGGVIVGYEMGRQLEIPAIFCERVNGEFTLRRGFELPENSRVLLVEDVVTTGKSSHETVKCIESFGAKVIAEACLIDRSGGKHGLPFPLFSLLQLEVPSYSPDNLPEHLKNIEPIKPGSRGLS